MGIRGASGSVIAAGLILLGFGCSGGSTGPDPDAIASITISPGTATLQVGNATTLQATVRNGANEVVTANIFWVSADPSIVQVASSGQATGLAPGSGRVVARTGTFADTATITVIPGSATFERSYLDGGYLGVPYLDRPDAATGPGSALVYSITEGALPDGLVIDPSDGEISGVPTTAGMHFFRLTATNDEGTASVIFAITISTAPPGGFNVFGVNLSDLIPEPGTRTAIDAAFARMEAIIVGNQPAYVEPNFGAEASCTGNFPIFHGQTIDDFAVLVTVGPIDGPGGALANGGGCGFIRGAPPIFPTGQLTLDSQDIAGRSAQAKFDIIWHELTHAIGFGRSVFQQMGLIAGDGTADPRFRGAQAIAEFQALGGAAPDVPLEGGFGAGSAFSHWDEAFFDSELMTPAKEALLNQIARLTIAAIADLGWQVSFATADPYVIPVCSPNCAPPFGAPGHPGEEIRADVIEEPVFRLGPGGEVVRVILGGGH